MNAAPSISRHYTNVEVSTTQVKVDAMAQQRQQLKRRSHELLANVDELGQSFSSVDSATVAIDEATLSAGDGGVSTEAYTAFSMAPSRKKRAEKKTINSPQDFFTAMLQSRGYPATIFRSLKGGYRNDPTEHQMLSYGVCLTKAIRSSNIPMVQLLLESGLNPNACNKFGESIVHAACRRGDYNMLRVLIKAGSSVQISDDFGRTPLHDACWTSGPNFETISILLDLDPWLLSISDCRGSTPLSYVRKAHWALWIGFLGAIADKYWPCLNGLENSPINNTDNSSQNVDFDRPIVPPLSCLEPNSRPLPDPIGSLLTLEVVELIASGKLRPEGVTKKEASYKCEETKSLTFVDKEPPHRVGITVDPMMSRTSLVGQSFARVSSHI